MEILPFLSKEKKYNDNLEYTKSGKCFDLHRMRPHVEDQGPNRKLNYVDVNIIFKGVCNASDIYSCDCSIKARQLWDN